MKTYSLFVFTVLTIALIGGIASSQNASAIEPIDLDSNVKLDSGVSMILPQVMDDNEKDNETEDGNDNEDVKDNETEDGNDNEDVKDNKDDDGTATTSAITTSEPSTTELTTPTTTELTTSTTTNDQGVEIQRLQQENNDLKQQISSLQQQIENLNKVLMEQIKVIMDTLNTLKG